MCTGLQCARITYNEARNLVNNLIKRTKIQYCRHKLEYADNKDMFGIVNSFIKPNAESLPNYVSTEECCNTLDGFRTFDVNEVWHIPKKTKKNVLLTLYSRV